MKNVSPRAWYDQESRIMCNKLILLSIAYLVVIAGSSCGTGPVDSSAPAAGSIVEKNGFGDCALPRDGGSHAEAVVRTNCLQVQAAVETFADLCGGRYPADVDSDRTPCGKTVIECLPRGHLGRNPYTGETTMLVNHSPVWPGSIGYTAVHEEYESGGWIVHGEIVGYVVSGYGWDKIIHVINTSEYSSKEALTIQNCRTVERAAREFAQNNYGVYPGDAGGDCNMYGNTLIDYLPGGRHLDNPYHGAKTEPVDGAAANPGETGYIAVYCGQSGRYCGYHISGAGDHVDTVCILAVGPPDIDGH
jgi:hypothetical protein